MNITNLPLSGLKLIELNLRGDARGFFVERFREDLFREAGMPTEFPQDNHSRSMPNVLRGLHYQYDPPQGKLVGVMHGRIWDVSVDLRPHSPTFGKYYGIELSDLNARLLWVPAGFAHGFCVLGNEPADFFYKVSALYNAKGEGGITWNDPDIAIAWPLANPLVSARDQDLPSFASYRKNPIQWKL